MLSKRGQARALTLDHKPILFEEAKRIIKVRKGERLLGERGGGIGVVGGWTVELRSQHVPGLATCTPSCLP